MRLNENVMKAIADLSNSREYDSNLIKAKALPAATSMIMPRYKRKEVGLEAVRALSNLSLNDNIKAQIVQLGALGYLISMSKSGTGLTKMYALATLTNLEHDTAATRIQMVARGYFARRIVEKKRQAVKSKQAIERKETSDIEIMPAESNTAETKA